MLNRVRGAAIVIIAIAWATACADGDRTPTPGSPVIETATASPIIQSQPMNPALVVPPFENLDKLVEIADLAVIARIEEVTSLTEASDQRGNGRIWYQDSTAVVERVIFGPQLETLTVRNALYAGPDVARRMPTKAPTFKPGERALVFLTSRSGFFDLRGPVYETVGGGVLWGKFGVGDGMVAGLSPITESRPLEPVVAWIRDARDVLAAPGLIGGIVSGLDAGALVTLRLVRMDATRDLGEAEKLVTWRMGNGPWQRNGLKLASGYYGVVAEASGHLPMASLHMFSVPDEGIAWRYLDLNVEMFRSEDAQARFGLPLCERPGSTPPVPTVAPADAPTATPPAPIASGTGGGVCYGGYLGRSLHIQRGIIGYASLPEGVTATVRVKRLARDPAMQYEGGPFSLSLQYPAELTPVEGLRAFKPIETVATLEVRGGRWGLVDPSLGGNPYLVTFAVPGYDVSPEGYQVAVIGGKVPHLVRGVDFATRESSQWPSAPPSPPGTPDQTAIAPSQPNRLTPTPTPSGGDTGAGYQDIVFVMKDRYRVGEPVEIRIRNQSARATYYYQRKYPACYNLKFFDSSTESRPYPSENPTRAPDLLLPGQFIVPRGTHCDLIVELPLKPGEEVVLFTWDQDVCLKDRWGCVESEQVAPGKYRLEGGFSQTQGALTPGNSREGATIATVMREFLIGSFGQ